MKPIEQFMQLFKGYEDAHGQHKLHAEPDGTGKLKGDAKTKGYGATVKEYDSHLKGQGTSLGLVPLLKNNTCWFSAIDIDTKGERPLKEKIEELEKRVRNLELPLVVCRSKSGGAHLYLFASSPIPAKLIRAKMKEFASLLGYTGCEIFPKQETRVDERDIGNWINIAYYGVASKEGTNRFCIRNGKPIKKLDDFVKYAEMMRIDEAALSKSNAALSEKFSDGPPCLQHLVTIGFEQGGRNNSLYNVGVYLKKKTGGDGWEDQLRKFNDEHMIPPLDGEEVSNVIRNLQRKEYFYTCHEPPICNHCDKKLCVKREFGIQGGGDWESEMIQIDSLTMCVSKDSVRWYLEALGKRVEITSTEQLTNWAKMKILFVEKFKTLFNLRQSTWDKIIQPLIQNCDIVYDPDDASRQGQFENLVDNFFTNSRPARNRDELIKGNCFVEEGRIHFRSEDLFNYLTIRRFQHSPHEVWTWLKSMGAKDKQLRIKSKMLRVWTLPEPQNFDTSTPIEVPSSVEEEL